MVRAVVREMGRDLDTYNRDSKLEMRKIDKTKYSLLIANNYQEYLTMVFYKEKDNKVIDQLREEFREKS